MIKNKSLLLIAILATFLFSCKSDTTKEVETGPTKVEKAEDLYGSWKLSKVEMLNKGSEEEQTKEKARLVRKGLLVNFFPDNLLTRIENQKYTSATWNFKGLDSAVMVGDIVDGKEDKFGFDFGKLEITKNQDTQMLKVENEKGTFLFKKVGDLLSNVQDDPFHPDNNKWRVIAPKSETYFQMHERLINYTEHNHALFKAAKERGKDKVVNSSSIGIYAYYDGAIKLIDGAKVPSSWMANFYSPDEAMDAYSFAGNYFKGGFIRKSHPDGFVASGEIIFRELVAKMKEKAKNIK